MTWPAFYGPTVIQASETVRSGAATAQYPRWTITGPGFYPIFTNTTTDKVLAVNCAILRGETVVIDCSPVKKTVIGSVQGNLSSLVTDDSEFWYLAPGDNAITVELGWMLPESGIVLSRRPI